MRVIHESLVNKCLSVFTGDQGRQLSLLSGLPSADTVNQPLLSTQFPFPLKGKILYLKETVEGEGQTP